MKKLLSILLLVMVTTAVHAQVISVEGIMMMWDGRISPTSYGYKVAQSTMRFQYYTKNCPLTRKTSSSSGLEVYVPTGKTGSYIEDGRAYGGGIAVYCFSKSQAQTWAKQLNSLGFYSTNGKLLSFYHSSNRNPNLFYRIGYGQGKYYFTIYWAAGG